MALPSRKRRLGPEQRRALEVLASSEHGMNAGLLVLDHGFERRVLAWLVKAGLAVAEREVAMAGGKPVEIFRIRITAAGRSAIEE
jgi:hypothetical protein